MRSPGWVLTLGLGVAGPFPSRMNPFRLGLLKPGASGDPVIKVTGDSRRTAVHAGFLPGKANV